MEKGTGVRSTHFLKHRCNSQSAIDTALAEGFSGVEIDLVWCGEYSILAHEHGNEVGPALHDVDFHGCIVAINIKEYGMSGVFGGNPTIGDHFFFDVPGPELDLYCAAGHTVFGRFSQWENQCLIPQVRGTLLDDFLGTEESQGRLMLRARSTFPVALISNQLRGGLDAGWVVESSTYVIRKTLP